MNIQEILSITLNSILQEPQPKSSVELFVNNRRIDKEQRLNCKKLYREYVESEEYKTGNLANAVHYLNFEEEILEVDGVFKDKDFFILTEKGE